MPAALRDGVEEGGKCQMLKRFECSAVVGGPFKCFRQGSKITRQVILSAHCSRHRGAVQIFL